jgi:hypothetical protein
MKVTVLLVVRMVIGDLDPSINVLPVGGGSRGIRRRAAAASAHHLTQTPQTRLLSSAVAQFQGRVSKSSYRVFLRKRWQLLNLVCCFQAS